jgi:hypothetical protein
MSEQPTVQQTAKTFPCASCGAKLEFAPEIKRIKRDTARISPSSFQNCLKILTLGITSYKLIYNIQ